MRIITGEYRGRKIEAPFGDDVRPTSDKVKESIFNMLMYDVADAYCVDLFAGTGNLGLEALSRGAKHCLFADNDRTSISFIKKNIMTCGATEKSRVIAGDYMKALRSLTQKADIFFIDPPYASSLYVKSLEAIQSLDLLSDEGIIVTEHDKQEIMPDRVGSLVKFKEKRYGKILVSMYCVDGEDA